MKGRKSGYVASPRADRLRRTGCLEQVVKHLEVVRRHVAGGGSITEALLTGTLAAWHARLALNAGCDSASVATWDERRTQAERLALVDRVLGELGGKQQHGGGWSVSR